MTFPANIKVEQWFAGSRLDTPGAKWLTEIAISTGGAGVGVGLVLTIACAIAALALCCCAKCCSKGCFVRSGAGTMKWRVRQSRWLFVAYAVCTISLLICAFIMYSGAEKAVSGLDRGFEGTETLAVDAQEFLCTKDPENLKFVFEAAPPVLLATYAQQCRPNSTIGFVAGADSRVVDLVSSANSIISNVATNITSDLDSAESASQSLKTSIDSIKTELDTIKASADSIEATGQQLPTSQSFDIPDVSANLNGISSSSTAISDAIRDISSAKAAADQSITKLQQDVQNELRSAQADITKALVEFSKEMISALDKLVDMEKDVKKASTDTVTPAMREYFVIGVTVFPFIGVLAFAFGGFGSARGGRSATKCGAAVVFVFLFWICLFMGLSGVFHAIFSDVCDNRPVMLETNLDTTFTVDLVTVNVGQKANELLKCGTSIDTPQTFAAILGISSVFNRTEDMVPVFDKLDESVAEISVSTTSLSESITSLETSISQFNEPISDNGGGVYSTAILDGQIQVAEDACNAMPTDTAKTDCLNNVSQMHSDSTAISTATARLTSLQSASVINANSILANLQGVKSNVDSIALNIAGLKQSTQSVVDYIGAVPEHTSCVFVGKAYQTVIDGAVCEDVNGAFGTAYHAGICTVAIMFVGFMFVLMPWRPIEKGGEEELSMYDGGLPIYEIQRKTSACSPVHRKADASNAP